MDRTDTVYLYVYIQFFVGAWLALRMPPPSLFSKPSGAESQVFKTESVSELFIYIYTYSIYIYIHSCFFIETHCPQEFLRIIYIYIYIYKYIIYIYIYLYLYVSMFGCRYPTHKTCRVQQKLRPSRTPTHWSLTKTEPTLWRIRLMTCDRHFFWFLQRICRHRKNRRHRNAGNTEYIHVKDRFFA